MRKIVHKIGNSVLPEKQIMFFTGYVDLMKDIKSFACA
jgi:hypothetical protein